MIDTRWNVIYYFCFVVNRVCRGGVPCFLHEVKLKVRLVVVVLEVWWAVDLFPRKCSGSLFILKAKIYLLFFGGFLLASETEVYLTLCKYFGLIST